MPKSTSRSQLTSGVAHVSASPRRFASTVRAVMVLAVVAGVTAGVPASPAWATTTGCSGGGTFTITDNVVSAGSLCTGTASIPSTVTSIAADAFKDNKLLTSVEFAENSELLTISWKAFNGSGLTRILIPKSVTEIGSFSLSTTALTSVTFEAGSALKTIYDAAFLNTGLKSVVIPKSVETITGFAFKESVFLTSVTFEGNAPTTFGNEVFKGVATNATVTVGLAATGFEPVDSEGLWEGLFLVRAATPSVPVAAVSGPVGPVLACMPGGPPMVAGASVTCTVTSGDPGIDILWRAAYNPVFAEAGVTLDASGSGTFSFTVPAAALGQPITVELVDWSAPVSIGVAGGPVPTSVPSGGGPVPVWSLVVLALAGGLALRRKSAVGVRG